MIIAVDGSAASGKGTLSKRLALHFDLAHLDTGSLYRALGLHLLTSGVTAENVEEKKWESNCLENASSNGLATKNQNSNKINQYPKTPKLPLPYIKNLRKWINNDKKAC